MTEPIATNDAHPDGAGRLSDSVHSSKTQVESQDVERSSQEKSHEFDPPPPPNGGYGWVCVACTFFINAHTWGKIIPAYRDQENHHDQSADSLAGVNSSYGVFLAYYLANNYYPNSTSLEFAFIGGLSISQALLVSPLATLTTRVYGTRTTLLIGVFFETLALISASFTHQVWQLFLSQGLCFGIGMGFLFVGSVGVIPQWFTTRRSLANGIGTAGSGIGGMTYSLATNAMIESLGVEWAFRILGILACVVNFVCAILIKDRNKAIGSKQLAFDYRLFNRYEYCLLLGWTFFSIMGYVVLLFSLPNYAVSLGLSSRQGSIVGALLNLGQGIGRPFVGMFSDKAGRINMAGAATFLAGLFCFVIWIFAKSFGVIVFFSILVGTVAGTIWTTIAPVGAEVVGLRDLPSALSIVWVFLVPPSTGKQPHSSIVGVFEAKVEQLRNLLLSNFARKRAIFTNMPKSILALCTWELLYACGYFGLGKWENLKRSKLKGQWMLQRLTTMLLTVILTMEGNHWLLAGGNQR